MLTLLEEAETAVCLQLCKMPDLRAKIDQKHTVKTESELFRIGQSFKEYDVDGARYWKT